MVDLFSLTELSHHEVIDVVAGLNDAAAGVDNIPMKLIKNVIHEIVCPVTHIINCSFKTGIFPDKLKISKVKPLFKQGSKNNMNNYRPISILPAFSKIIEKLISVKLESFMNINNIISESQYGFRRERSTSAAIINLTDHVLKSFDENEYTLGVFLDLRKAFDCVNHEILLRKLNHYGIRGTPLKLLTSYLTHRQQYTCVSSKLSNPIILTHSVPQGSILGPLLFNIYINDIVKTSAYLDSILFADDSCFYFSHTDPQELIYLVNSDLSKISKWLASNRLTLNIEKSHCILFNRKLKIPPNLPEINIDNKTVQLIENTIFLGITIQSNLKWNLHLESLTNKLNKYSAIIYQTRHSLDNNSLKLIYNALVYSCLTYGNIIWGKSPAEHQKGLVIAQKRIIRTIKYRKRYDHTNNDFLNLGFLKLKDINIYFCSIFVYKILNNLAQPLNYFHLVNESNTYNVRNSNNLRPPLVGSSQSQTSPAYYSCLVWNDLPIDIRSRPSIASFKLALKSHLLQKYLEV